ncbi:MAG: hypothetical protein AAGF12_38975 [Myxococcota bacterium]
MRSEFGLVLLVAACSGRPPVDDDPPQPAIEIVVINRSTETLTVRNQVSCGFDPVVVTDAEGNPLRIAAGQAYSCTETQGDDPCPEVGSCSTVAGRVLEPGARWTGSWDGRYVETRQLSARGSNCPDQCVIRKRVPEQPVVLRAIATACTEEDCRGGPRELVAETNFEIGGGGAVELEFDDP